MYQIPSSIEALPVQLSKTLTDEQAAGLTGSPAVPFAKVLREIIPSLQLWPSSQELILEVLMAIATATALSESEQHRRATLIAKKFPAKTLTDAPFLAKLGHLPMYVQSGVASALPPHCLPVFFGKRDSLLPTHENNQHHDNADEPPDKLPPSSIKPDALPLERSSPSRGTLESDRKTVVVLLSRFNNPACEANMVLLQQDDIPVFRASTDEELSAFLAKPDVCGFIIDGSFWAERTAEQQVEVLTRIASYSSISCLVVDSDNFRNPEQIHHLINQQRPVEATHMQVQVRPGSRLSGSDLPCFRHSAKLLEPADRPKIIIKDLSEAEIVTVIATAKLFFASELKRTEESLVTLGLAVMAGGRSGAKLLRLHLHGLELPLIVKVAPRDDLRGEVERYTQYIALRCSGCGYIKPFLHFHGMIGVALFSLVEDADFTNKPAPTLEEKIKSAITYENWNSDDADLNLRCSNLEYVIGRAADKLGALNNNVCQNPSHPCYAYLRGSGLVGLHSRGITWNAPELNNQRLKSLVDSAYALLNTTGDIAIVHGDTHLRNILVQDRDAYFIDYACSGPGHPAFDLVRLECALTFSYFRQLDTEDSFVDFQSALSIEIADMATLEERFPAWFSSRINQALIRSMILCRDKCLGVLEKHGANHEQYIAAKFIMACHSLMVPELQAGLVRGTLRSLAVAFPTG